MLNNLQQHQRVICLMGPTASGKTALALELVERYPCDIISVDSALVYKGMDIGTAKPSKEELAKAPHRLIDICDPASHYSAADFCQDAKYEIDKILANNRIPLLVGGTMLYFHLLQQGISTLPQADSSIRKKLDEKLKNFGSTYLHEELSTVDPIASQRIHPNDPQRLQRALEIYYASGKTMTSLLASAEKTKPDYHFENIALIPKNREKLRELIAIRFEIMLENNFISEVKELIARGDLYQELPSMRSVGYRQAWAYLNGDLNFQQMKEKSITATRQLAKRQITWLRKWDNLLEIDAFNEEEREILLEKL